MTRPHARRIQLPHQAWYPVATSEEIGQEPLARVLLGQPVVLYRTPTGAPVALEDRCAHRPVRLSDGIVEGDTIRSSYTGFRYRPDGQCVAVPTQAQVPYGAVRSYPVRDDASFVWVWGGEPGLAGLRATPDTSFLRSSDWTTFGGVLDTRAGLGLLLDNFCDITHVAELDRIIAPPALTEGPTPPMRVEVSETNVRFTRRFPAAPLPGFQAEALGLPAESRHAQTEEGEFVGPGFWIDRWTATVEGHQERDGSHQFIFSHGLVPVSATQTRHVWKVSRNFEHDAATGRSLKPFFETYYARVGTVLEQMQQILGTEGGRPEVAVAADAAVTQVRRIIRRMVEEELGGPQR